jgi:hypothetical protein
MAGSTFQEICGSFLKPARQITIPVFDAGDPPGPCQRVRVKKDDRHDKPINYTMLKTEVIKLCFCYYDCMPRKLNTYRIVLYVIVLSVFLAIAGSVFLHSQNNYRSYNGRNYIPKEYERITLPSSLKFVRKDWDDVHASDPSLRSIWVYEYDITNGTSHAQIKNAIVTDLERSHYMITNQESDQALDAFRFVATNSTIYMNVDVGYGCPYVHCVMDSSAEKVFTSVALSDE